ncbi:hypothetical protein SERLA73DRAFT_178507 [Serpula lacrymans var. lacrymans S7.3]|uniref:N-acetyltransferase domain-containing protein n=2 Tax=Serpula lacrymans var. lacrymans TaxID=341189 RepID=F8PRS2_SERL3|nr:uncharacterized protein SERLADRAFT_462992 [Serpula lacrymans var. lacrymans S7.9]EGO00642.1 hypothetical protein SERLA73DRAFT_178507 [Serpula lacrymans var. lacrymans S7.3]EGO26197.1 hypothetical protein SERLADRAFT_462992 [Serpula lacrymans var. lacrymans S7.9]
MPQVTVQRVERPSETQIEASVALFVSCMKDNIAALSLSGCDATLLDPMARSTLMAGILAGEYYNATDESGDVVGFALWMPPGEEMFSKPEQRELGLNDFMARLPEVGRDYYKNTYSAVFLDFVSSCLGPTGKRDAWWLHMLMVHPERQRQGIGRALVGPVLEKATQKGEVLALSTTTHTNVPIYTAMGFKEMGGRTVPSPLGEWPLHVFSLDTRTP